MGTVASTLLVPITGNASLATTTVIAHWTCDEASGTRYDSTSNNNDLADNNTVGNDATGVIGSACDFIRANDEYLSIADASQTGLDFTTDVSFSFWVKKDGDDNGLQALFMKDVNGANNTREYLIYYNDNSATPSFELSQFPTGYSYPSYYSGQYINTLTDATWEHYVITIDRDSAGTGNKFYVYKNGTGLGYFTNTDGTGATSFQNTATAFQIGYGAGGWVTGFDGSLDEIAIFNNIINADEVSQLYNAGDGLTWPFSTSTTATTSTSTTATTTTTDVSELKWVIELYLAIFAFLVFTYIGYRFTKLFL